MATENKRGVMKKRKPVRCFAIRDAAGNILPSSARYCAKDVRRDWSDEQAPWSYWLKQGVRVVPVVMRQAKGGPNGG